MRISEDTDSWKAGGVLRRDFRHTHNGPEVPIHVGGRKKKPVKKRSDHKHEYEILLREWTYPWWRNGPTLQKWECLGCDKTATKQRPPMVEW